ncbi:MAG: methylenetetrahydrofolate reductase [NAD(P)H] [Planctomycetes bacterium]|nr:methylenetetrahydrofolate reductase [NAD(P)H] [Planctomycetota bacterium]
MQLGDFFRGDRLGLSFELFPPKSDEQVQYLMSTVGELNEFTPDFYTCTYGAGGSTRDRTLEIITAVKQRFGQKVATHLTCVGSTVDQLRDYLRSAMDVGTDYIVALRGDPPKGQTEFQQTVGGLRYANELVDLLRSEFPNFGIAVAGYPEIHQEAPSAAVDLQNLKRKVDSGADIIVTQLFYINDDYFRFVDNCRAAGITIPIVPGILPVTNLAQIQRITALCKAKLPDSFVNRLSEQDSAEWQFRVGVEFATQQVSELLDAGVPGVHFYVLNKSQATSEVLRALRFVTSAR